MKQDKRLTLNDDAIGALRYPWGRGSKKRFFVVDTNGGAPTGFGVRVYPNNEKAYVLRYYDRDRRQRLVTLGRVAWLTYMEARAIARACVRRLELGEKPIKIVEHDNRR